LSQLLRWIALAAVASVVLLSALRSINGATVDRDSAQSLLMSVNLAHQGVISLDEHPPYTPSNYREPVPIVLGAAAVRLEDLALGVAPAADYFAPERVKLLKYQNLLWLALLCVSVFWCIHIGTRSYYASLTGALLIGVLFSRGIVNDFATETAATAVLLLASALLTEGLLTGRVGRCLAAGALFGLLVLIKASAFYVFVGLAALLIAVGVIWRARINVGAWTRNIGLMAAACLVVVVPWMLRNKIQLGALQIAQRAGVVLWVRALKDQMSPEEYAGTFYVWAPEKIQPLMGRLLGFGPRDLARGGRLQHLNRSEKSDFAAADVAADLAGRPQEAISYYRRARAERVKLENQLEAAHTPNAGVVADELLQKQALKLIEAHPLRHLALTIPFLWRGAAIAFPVFVAAIGLGLYRRRYDIVLLTLPSFGLMMLYALLTHFIPRYGVPLAGMALALLVIGATLAIRTAGQLRSGTYPRQQHRPG
jgi:hypothetical protein